VIENAFTFCPSEYVVSGWYDVLSMAEWFWKHLRVLSGGSKKKSQYSFSQFRKRIGDALSHNKKFFERSREPMRGLWRIKGRIAGREKDLHQTTDDFIYESDQSSEPCEEIEPVMVSPFEIDFKPELSGVYFLITSLREEVVL
jgi:hypothetical protein